MSISIPFILLIQGKENPCADIALAVGKQTLGRVGTCQLVVPHKSVSRQHAQFVVTRRSVTVTDLGSRHGTFVNGVRLDGATVSVRVGDELRFGGVTFRLEKYSEELLGRRAAEADSDKWEPPPSLADGLSPRQREVLECLKKGMSEKEVAAKLGLSRNTVHEYVTGIHKRLGVHSLGELLAKIRPRR
jgi:DNA-binding CsgD family transcriptional regulator